MHRPTTAVAAALSILLTACGAPASSAPTAGPARPLERHVSLNATAIWRQSTSPFADSAPAYAAKVRLPGGGTRPMVYVLAGNNGSNCNPGDPVRRATLYAFDAGSGKRLWARSTSGPSRCTTAGPAVDPSGAWVYTAGLDGKLHRYNAGTGKESTTGGWPHTITLMPDVEKQSATPTIHRPYLYSTTSGFIGDQGHYQGHLVTIDLSNGKSAVFNTLCSNIHTLLGSTPGRPNYCSAERSALFGRGEGAIDPVTHDVYIVTGNGPWNGRTEWGDSLLKLDPGGTHLLDSFTPTNQAYLEQTDADLGSTGPALFPPIHAGGHTYHLLAQAGKGGATSSGGPAVVWLLNRDNLSGKGGLGNLGGQLGTVATPGGCEVLTAPAVWHGAGATWLVLANDCAIAGYRLVGSSPSTFRLEQVWTVGHSGTTPVIKNGVAWIARSGEIAAYRVTDGALLWHGGGIGDIHWEYPLVAGGKLYLTDNSGRLTAWRIAAR